MLATSSLPSIDALRLAMDRHAARSQPAESLLDIIAEYFPGGICVFDANLRMVMCNSKLKQMLDYSPDLFDFGMPTLEQIYRYNALRGEYGKGDAEALVAERMALAHKRVEHVYERRRPNGTVLQIRGVPLPTGGFLTIYLDVTEERQQHETVRGAANTERRDTLLSRDELLEKLSGLLANLKAGRVVAIHCLDVDKFDQVIRDVGTDVSKVVLDALGQRLAHTIRDNDYCARLGGDRFIVVQTNVAKPSDVVALERRLVEASRQPIAIESHRICLTVGRGLALAPRDGTDAEALIVRSEEMMLRSKFRDSVNAHLAEASA